MLLLDGGLGHLLKEKGLRIPGLPYDQQFLAGVLVSPWAAAREPHPFTASLATRLPVGRRGSSPYAETLSSSQAA